MRRALESIAAGLRRFQGDKVDLLVGEPCFGPPVEIQAAFRTTVGEPASGYGPPAGLPELRKILADRQGGASGDPDRVLVTHGAKGGLLAVLSALVEQGDEVIHPLPCYPAYPAMIRRLGGVPVGVAESSDGFSGWSEEALAASGPRTRAIVLSSPSNPSGSVMGGEDLATLVRGARERGLRLVLDEAYSAFLYGSNAVDPGIVDPDCRTLVRVHSASKSFALCGWRIGWIVADAPFVKRVAGVQSALINPPATPPQRAMLALPDVPETYFEANRDAVQERLSVMVESLQRAGFDAAMPAGGFYLWVDIRNRLDPKAPDSAAWCERLAEDRGVGLWPGDDYGSPGWVRFALPQGDRWRDDVKELERRLSP